MRIDFRIPRPQILLPLLVLVLLGSACGTGGTEAGTKATGVRAPDGSGAEVAAADAQDAGTTADSLDAADVATDAVDTADAAETVVAQLPADVSVLLGGMPLATTLFQPEALHILEVTIDPAEWQDYLQGVAQPDGTKVYDWHPATLAYDGLPFGQVAVRGFGNGSQIDNPKKPNIRVKFDHYDTNGTGPEGQKSFKLKASGQDASFVREPLMYELVRAIGGHAPRTGWARVRVNGDDYGLYQVLEVADKRMFKSLFGNNDGPKYESKFACLGFDCPTWGCDGLKDSYKGDPGDGAELAALAKAVTEATDDSLLADLQARVNVGALLADYAVDAVASNLDGLASAGQNFEVYVDQKTNLIEVIASGADLTFDNFHGAWYSLEQPWGAPNSWCADRTDHLYQRIWQAPKTKPLLMAKLRALQCGPFQASTFITRVDQLHDLLKTQVDGDPKSIFPPASIADEYARIKAYALKRQDTLVQLLGPCP